MSTSEHDELVRQSFARQTALFSGPDSPFATRPGTGLSWIEPLSPDLRVLDVACGAAHATETIAAEVREVVGLDLTRELLELGRTRLAAAGVLNVLLQEGNATALPFVDESFDLVNCRSSLHHFADPALAVSEMLRVCRRGGRVVLLDLIAPIPATREEFDRLHRLVDPSHARAFVEAELPTLLPDDAAEITYAETSIARLPLDIAITEQSARDEVVADLHAELGGEREPSGFEPALEGESLVVSFTTTVIHAIRS
jgi:ubiquinone/menaquinone biosynthesis C-methylase UbiE